MFPSFLGTDTTATFLEWVMLYMAAHPEVQSRVQDEIDWVLARRFQPEGRIALADRPDMPYTEAVMEEMSRQGRFPHESRKTSTKKNAFYTARIKLLIPIIIL